MERPVDAALRGPPRHPARREAARRAHRWRGGVARQVTRRCTSRPDSTSPTLIAPPSLPLPVPLSLPLPAQPMWKIDKRIVRKVIRPWTPAAASSPLRPQVVEALLDAGASAGARLAPPRGATPLELADAHGAGAAGAALRARLRLPTRQVQRRAPAPAPSRRVPVRYRSCSLPPWGRSAPPPLSPLLIPRSCPRWG
jgi:hypothetical protein